MIIKLFVPGTPAGAGSKVAFRPTPESKMIVAPASKKTKPWMQTVKWAAIQKYDRMVLLESPLKLKIVFYFLHPKGHFGTGRNAGILKDSAPAYPAKYPDLSKLTRAIEDALTGIIWKDDKQVVQHETIKLYSDKPGAAITIEAL